MGQLGFDTQFLNIKLDASADKIWEGVKTRYWGYRDTYYLPICQFHGQTEDEEGEPAALEAA